MKKLILLILILTGISSAASAQTYIGGTVGVGMITDDGETLTAISFSSEIGKRFNSRVAAGLSVGVNYSSYIDNTTVTALPYIRIYIAKTGIVEFFGEAAAGFQTSTETTSGFAAALRPGISINLTKRFALIARTDLLSYMCADGISAVGLSLGNDIHAGVQFTF